MKIYMAPLEGVTGHVFRNVYHELYGKACDIKYFIPFISPNKTKGYTTRELKDIAPENNKDMQVVPQIMANDAYLFLQAADMLRELGYHELNLNLGCPSGTVVSKGRGAGFLGDINRLDAFLKEVLASEVMSDARLSVKTRIGLEAPEEFRAILAVYNDHPLSEVIIHPRVRTDYYKNTPNMEVYSWAMSESVHPLCYNGDIFNINDYNKLIEKLPGISSLMLGRGLVGNPILAEQIMGLAGQEGDDVRRHGIFMRKLFDGYMRSMDSEVNAMHKMKEVWIYAFQICGGQEKAYKQIKKSRDVDSYLAATRNIWME